MKRFISLSLLVLSFSPAASFALTKAAQSCEQASECKGRLPKYCIACTNGKSGGCAHWTCVDHKCKKATCDLAPVEVGK